MAAGLTWPWTCLISCEVITRGGCAVLTLGHDSSLAWWRLWGALHLLGLVGEVVWELVWGGPSPLQGSGSTRTLEGASL